MLGVLIVLLSTVLGARLLGSGSHGTPVWVARHDLAAGLALRAGDVEVRDVELSSSAPRYLSAATPFPDGLVLSSDVVAGELIPASALSPASGTDDRRIVTVPVDRFHVPADLARGERVDVYVTPRGAADGNGVSSLIARGVDVLDVDDASASFGGDAATSGVSVSVPAAAVAALVGGLGRGVVDVVRVPAGAR